MKFNITCTGNYDVLERLVSELFNALEYLKNRNRDYSEEEYNKDIDISYFMYARLMTVVIEKETFYLCSITTLEEVNRLETLLNNRIQITYIADESNDIDTIVGDLYEFLKKNEIKCSSYDYYKAVKDENYDTTEERLIEILKG